MTEPRPSVLPGLDEACEELAAGRPVVLPNACPMAYVIVGTDPAAINDLKRRPTGQNVGVNMPRGADRRAVAPILDLPPQVLAGTVALMRRELVSALLPLRPGAAYPHWIAPAVRDGQLLVFAGYWEPLARVWDGFPRLFGSSANRSGSPVAGTAAQARAVFGDEALVVDGDAVREPGCTLGSSTIVRVSPDGSVGLHRRGAQDAAGTLDLGTF